jgi:pimeloyl-ACP methyl ester carboxylesterase
MIRGGQEPKEQSSQAMRATSRRAQKGARMSREMAHPTDPTDVRPNRRLPRVVELAMASLVCAAALLAIGAASAAAVTTTELPVAFQVTNTNASQDPCVSNGATYTIRGHISGPQAALEHGTAKTITMYLFGYEAGEWNWDLKGVAGYDYAAEMAKRGHVSLTLDELGYGTSDHPENGNETCQGAEADIAHQIIQKLRHSEYTLGQYPPIAFKTIVLAGHDIGGSQAEIEAYSYTEGERSDINGLILVTYADQGFTPYIIEKATLAANDWCTQSSTGYVHYVTEQEYRTLLFYDADPRVINATNALRNANPCGIIRSQPQATAIDRAHLSQIKVPVLIVFGENETLVWTRQGEEEQQGNFTGSPDKQTVFIPEARHFPMFERTAPKFDAVMSNWLASRFPSP